MSEPFLEMLAADDPELRCCTRCAPRDPVHFVEPLGFWLVTRHDDVKRLYNDPENVTQRQAGLGALRPAPEGTMLRWAEDHGMFSLGREEHARFRRLVSAAFTPRAVRRMDGQIREVVERTAAPLRGRHGEVIDLLGEFTNIVPNTVISRITGVPPGDDEVRFRRIAQSMIAGFMPFTPPRPARARPSAASRSSRAGSASWWRSAARIPRRISSPISCTRRTPTTRCARTTSCCCSRA